MTTDSARGTVAFKLREPGFLANYEVCVCVFSLVFVLVCAGYLDCAVRHGGK